VSPRHRPVIAALLAAARAGGPIPDAARHEIADAIKAVASCGDIDAVRLLMEAMPKKKRTGSPVEAGARRRRRVRLRSGSMVCTITVPASWLPVDALDIEYGEDEIIIRRPT
jgi:hypothetical protein